MANKQLQSIAESIAKIKSKVQQLKPQVQTLAKAKQAGMKITPKTSVEQAKKYISLAEIKPEQPPVDIDFLKSPLDLTAISQAEIASKAALEEFQKMIEGLDETQKKMAEQSWQTIREIEQAKPQEGLFQKMLALAKKREEMPRISQEEIYERTLAKYGITPETFSQINTLTTQLGAINQQIAAAEAKFMKQNELIASQPIAMPVIVGEQAALERQHNIEKAALAAQASAIASQIQAMRGNIQMAVSLADRAVSAAVWDYTQKVNDMEWAFNTYSDIFEAMDRREREEWDRIYQLQIEEKEKKEQETRQIMDIILDAANKGVIIDYNPKVDDLESITQKYARNVGAVVQRELEEKEVGEVRTVPWSLSAAQLGLVGLPQIQASDILSSETYPEWFREKVEKEASATFPEETIQKKWQEFREPYVKKLKEVQGTGEIPSDVINILNNPNASLEDLINAYNNL